MEPTMAAQLGLINIRGDVRIGGAFIDGSNGTLGYSFFPSNADTVIDTGDTTFFSNPTENHRAFRNMFMHELGHGIGLDHVVSNTDRFLMEPSINISFDGPQLDDIRGAQWYYGDGLEKSNGGSGNETPALATNLGWLVNGFTRIDWRGRGRRHGRRGERNRFCQHRQFGRRRLFFF